MDNHNIIYLLNKRSLKIEKLYVNKDNEALKEFLEVENYIFKDYSPCVSMQLHLDTNLKLN